MSHPRFRRSDRLLDRAETVEQLRRYGHHQVADALEADSIEPPPVCHTHHGQPLYRWGDVCAWTERADLRLWAARDGVEEPGSVGAFIAAFAKDRLIEMADPTVVTDPAERSRIIFETYWGHLGIEPTVSWLAHDASSVTESNAE
jgi:hypothetical protein